MALPPPHKGREYREHPHGPLAGAPEGRILLIDRSGNLPACDDKLIPGFKQLPELEQITGGQVTFGKERHNRLAGRDLVGVHVGCVQPAFGLPVNRNPLLLKILNGTVRAAAVDGKDVVEAMTRQFRDVNLTAPQFVPDDQTQRDFYFAAPDVSFRASSSASATATSEFICSQRPQRPSPTIPLVRAHARIRSTASGLVNVLTG